MEIFRPEFDLQLLREEIDAETLRLRLMWLRSQLVDASTAPQGRTTLTSDAMQCLTRFPHALSTLALRGHYPLTPVVHVVLPVVRLLTRLTTLDLTGVTLDPNDCFLESVAVAHPFLQKLSIRGGVPQHSVEGFHHLQTFDCSGCSNVSSVAFCTATLRVLIGTSSSLDDEGLQHAVHLAVLHVAYCPSVTTVAPFGASLRELDASGPCGIGSVGLAAATSLRVLIASNNHNIDSIEMCAHCLTSLDASFRCGIDDDELGKAHRLVQLNVMGNRSVTRLGPSAPILRELRAGATAVLRLEELDTAVNLVKLHAGYSGGILTAIPTGSLRHTLRELDIQKSESRHSELSSLESLVQLSVSECPNIADASLPSSILELSACGAQCGLQATALATLSLVSLRLSFNVVITLLPLKRPLMHLNAAASGLSDASLAAQTKLVTLNAGGNAGITSLEPFANSLVQLIASGEHCGITDAAVSKAPLLRELRTHAIGGGCNVSIPYALVEEVCSRNAQLWGRRLNKADKSSKKQNHCVVQ